MYVITACGIETFRIIRCWSTCSLPSYMYVITACGIETRREYQSKMETECRYMYVNTACGIET